MPYKHVFFVRHAKSSWDQPGLSDLDRPLNKRGLTAAPAMAQWISGQHPSRDPVLISSPAKRAVQTAGYFAQAYQIDTMQIMITDELYFQGSDAYLKATGQLEEHTNDVFVFGHNPSMEYLVGQLVHPYNGPVPTCAVFKCKRLKASWKNLTYADLKIENHYFPKMVLGI